MRIKAFGYIMLMLAILLAASMPIAFKLGSNISPIKLVLFTSLVGTVASFIATLFKGTTRQSLGYFTKKTSFLAIVSFGIFEYVALTFILSISTHFASAALVAVVYRTWALMLVLLAPIIIRERVSRYDIIAVLIGFSSFAVVMLQGTPISMPLYLLPIVGLVLLGAFFDAFANAISKRYSYELTSSIFAYNLVAFIIFLPLALLTGQASIIGINANDIIAIAFIGIIVDVVSTFAFIGSIRTLNVTVVGTSNILVPFITVLLGFVLLNEQMYWYYFIIAIGVAAGLLVQRYAPKTSNYIAKNNSKELKYAIFDVSGAFVGTDSAVIYKMLKGNGRALAVKLAYEKELYDIIKNEQKERSSAAESSASNEYIMFTDSKPFTGISATELAFIKDVVGASASDTVLIGIGNPDVLEKKLIEMSNAHKPI